MQRLVRVPQWVAWKYQLEDGTVKKPPLNPYTGSRASVETREPGGVTRRRAAAGCETTSMVGGSLVGQMNIWGADLDDCYNPETRTFLGC